MLSESFSAVLGRQLQRPRVAIPLGVFGCVCAYIVEHQANPDVSLEIIYLFLTALVAWSTAHFWQYGLFGVFAAGLHVSAGYHRIPPSADYPSVLWNIGAHLVLFLLIGFIADRLRRAFLTELERSSTDPLTGVASRRAFLELLEREAQRGYRYGRTHSIAFIDLDRFREVNNQFGHRRGDAVLVACARAMQQSIRSSDTLGRIGGDEFALLLPETDHEAKHVANKLLSAVTNAIEREGLGGVIGVSIGVVTCPCIEPAQGYRLLGCADTLMYRAKRAGGNAVVHEILEQSGSSINTP